MKKRLLIIFLVSFGLISLSFVISQSSVPYNPAGNVGGSLVSIDSNTGLPSKFSDFKNKADDYRNREQNNSYLFKRWTVILADKPIIGPGLFYTEKLFSSLNPLWKYSFGIEFSWSLVFFFHVFLWCVLVVIVSITLHRSELLGLLFSVIVGVIIASIIGSSGIIGTFVSLMKTAVVNLWAFTAIIIIMIILVYLYSRLFKSFEKEAEEEKLKRRKKSTEVRGKIDEKALEKYTGVG